MRLVYQRTAQSRRAPNSRPTQQLGVAATDSVDRAQQLLLRMLVVLMVVLVVLEVVH